MTDLRDSFYSLLSELEKKLNSVKLDAENKDLLIKALDLGYSAAFCERTSDIHGSYFESEDYRKGYEKIRSLIHSK